MNKLNYNNLSSKIISTLSLSWFSIAIFITSISIIVPLTPRMPQNGLDPSWGFGMNQAVSQNLEFGREIIFTFGPYSSIYTQNFHPATDHLMIWGALAFAICFSFALFLYFKNVKLYIKFLLLAVLSGFSLSLDAIFFFYPLLVATYLMTLYGDEKEISHNNIYIYFIMIFLFFPFGLLPLIKGTLSTLCILILMLSLFFLILKKQWKLAVIICVISSTSLVFCWVLAGQQISNLVLFFKNMSPIISGYTEAMAKNGPILEILIFVSVSIFFVATLIKSVGFKSIEAFLLCAIFTLTLYVAFKAGFVRHDGHAMISASMVVLAGLLLSCFNKRNNLVIFFSFFVYLFIYSHYQNITIFSIMNNIVSTYSSTYNGFRSRVQDKQLLTKKFEEAMINIQQNVSFPNMEGTTDIYSYNQSLLIASRNKWNPRPIFQSYSAYTTALSDINKMHLLSYKSPDNIIFSVETIDGRMPTMDDGASWPIILFNYKPINYHDGFLFLNKNIKALVPILYSTPKIKCFFDNTIQVPDKSDFTFVKLDINSTFLGKVFSIFLKPTQLKIRLTLSDNSIKEYRIISDMAKSGFIISPLIENSLELGFLYVSSSLLFFNKVKSFSITSTNNFIKLWNPTFFVQFDMINIAKDPGQHDALKVRFPNLLNTKISVNNTDKSEGNIDYVNLKGQILQVGGWLTSSVINNGSIPDRPILLLKERTSKKCYIVDLNGSYNNDAALYFRKISFKDSGFFTSINTSSLQGVFSIYMGFMEDGNIKLLFESERSLVINGIIKKIAFTKKTEELNFYSIDSVQFINNSLEIHGWTIRKGFDTPISSGHFILKDIESDEMYQLPTIWKARPDVTKHFEKDNKSYDKSGIYCHLPQERLRIDKNNTYLLGVLYQDDEVQKYVLTNTAIFFDGIQWVLKNK